MTVSLFLLSKLRIPAGQGRVRPGYMATVTGPRNSGLMNGRMTLASRVTTDLDQTAGLNRVDEIESC